MNFLIGQVSRSDCTYQREAMRIPGSRDNVHLAKVDLEEHSDGEDPNRGLQYFVHCKDYIVELRYTY